MFKIKHLLFVLIFFSIVDVSAQRNDRIVYFVRSSKNQKFLTPLVESTISSFTNASGDTLYKRPTNLNLLIENFDVEYSIYDIYSKNTTGKVITNSRQRNMLDNKLTKELKDYDKLLIIYIEEFNELLELQFWLYNTLHPEDDLPVFDKLKYKSSSVFINPNNPDYKDKIVFALKQIFNEANVEPKISIGIGSDVINHYTYSLVGSEIEFNPIVTDPDSPPENLRYSWELTKGTERVALEGNKRNPRSKFNQVGDYQLRLVVSDGLAYSDTAKILIKVISKPSLGGLNLPLYFFKNDVDKKSDVMKLVSVVFEIKSNSNDSTETLNFKLLHQRKHSFDTLNLDWISIADSLDIPKKLLFNNLIAYERRHVKEKNKAFNAKADSSNSYNIGFYPSQDFPLGSYLLQMTPKIDKVEGRYEYKKLYHQFVTRFSIVGGVSFSSIKNSVEPNIRVKSNDTSDSIEFSSLLWSLNLGIRIELRDYLSFLFQTEFPFTEPGNLFSEFKPNYKGILTFGYDHRVHKKGFSISFLCYLKNYSYSTYEISGSEFKTGFGLSYNENVSRRFGMSVSFNLFPRKFLFTSSNSDNNINYKSSIAEFSYVARFSILKKK